MSCQAQPVVSGFADRVHGILLEVQNVHATVIASTPDVHGWLCFPVSRLLASHHMQSPPLSYARDTPPSVQSCANLACAFLASVIIANKDQHRVRLNHSIASSPSTGVCWWTTSSHAPSSRSFLHTLVMRALNTTSSSIPGKGGLVASTL